MRALLAIAAAYWLTVGGGCGTGGAPNVEIGPCNEAATVRVYREHTDGTLTFYREIEGGTGRRVTLPPGQYRFVGRRFDVP